MNSLYIHCNGYRQIFFENLPPNQRFGVEIVYFTTISTIYNHYHYARCNVRLIVPHFIVSGIAHIILRWSVFGFRRLIYSFQMLLHRIYPQKTNFRKYGANLLPIQSADTYIKDFEKMKALSLFEKKIPPVRCCFTWQEGLLLI